MTPEMVARATGNLGRTDYTHVDFRLGNIEQLPVDDASVDVIMSNCVINLSPDKAAVFRELPAAIADDPTAYTGCVSGAASVGELERLISAAGFTGVRIEVQAASRALVDGWSPGDRASEVVASALIEAVKPEDTRADACCDTVLLSECCAPDAKVSCCGSSLEASSCGCHAGGSSGAVR